MQDDLEIKKKNEPQEQVLRAYIIPIPDNENDGFSLSYYLRVIADYKKLILIIVFLSTLIALVLSFLMTPIYRAEVILAPRDDDEGGRLGVMAGQFGNLASLAGIEIGNNNNSIDEAVATLKSREFTLKFIDDEKLMPELFAELWDKKKRQWKKTEVPPSAWNAYNLFNNKVREVRIDKKTGLVALYIEWKDPILAADWANKIVRYLNLYLKDNAISESERNLSFLKKQIAETNIVKMQQSIHSLIETELKKAMLANVSDEYTFRVIDPAMAPESSIKPKRHLIVIIGFMLGCFLSIFLIVVHRAFLK